MKNIGIIPVRLDSSRFPGKPLADIHGIPMVGHVYYRSKLNTSLDEVYIATPDQKIKDYADSIGAECIMTAITHERASDRASEAMLSVEKIIGRKVDNVVMIQGDEPMIFPKMIDDGLTPLIDDPSILVTNLMSPLQNIKEQEDPNEVKVVVDQSSFALYFSREPIPSKKKCLREFPVLKQVCIISFQRDFLLAFNKLSPSPLEITESIDMLRVLEHGFKVKMVLTSKHTYSVDTQQDIEKVIKRMKDDPMRAQYSGNTKIDKDRLL